MRRLLLVAVLASGVAACVADSVVEGDAAPDSPMGGDATMDSPVGDGGSDTGTVDTGVDSGPCSNPLVGNVLSLSNGGGAGTIPGSGPVIVGDFKLTAVLLDCNGACGVDPGSILGGLRVSSSGPGLIAMERRIEIQQTDGGAKRIDFWSGTFDQLNKKLSVDEKCPMPKDAGWAGGYPLLLDGGATNQLRIRFDDVRFHINTPAPADVTAILTFTKQ